MISDEKFEQCREMLRLTHELYEACELKIDDKEALSMHLLCNEVLKIITERIASYSDKTQHIRERIHNANPIKSKVKTEDKMQRFMEVTFQHRCDDLHLVGLYINATNDLALVLKVKAIIDPIMINKIFSKKDIKLADNDIKSRLYENNEYFVEPYCHNDPECELCHINKGIDDCLSYYCLFKCQHCIKQRTEEARKRLPNLNEFVKAIPSMVVQNILTNNDKIYVVLLSSLKEDGRKEYVADILSKNFLKFFPKSFPANAFCYAISNQEPISLFGMIRYDEKGKYHICPTSAHLKNNVRAELTGLKHKRELQIKSLTNYVKRQYITPKDHISAFYNLIKEYGVIRGDCIEKFLS